MDKQLQKLLHTYFTLVDKENKNLTGVGESKLSSQIDELERKINLLKQQKEKEKNEDNRD